eukprot:490793-Ditylum_brightwellii.AAC.1
MEVVDGITDGIELGFNDGVRLGIRDGMEVVDGIIDGSGVQTSQIPVLPFQQQPIASQPG